jgi:hypothetical protein
MIEYGYQENPKNGLGIVRARTQLGNLRLWDIPREERALDLVVSEISSTSVPGLYLLFEDNNSKKVYIGQTENLKSRLSTHIRIPEGKIKNWHRAIIINDGRGALQSDLNDENVRLLLENYLVELFKVNGYQMVTSSSRQPSLSPTQLLLANTFKDEMNILLTRKSKITKLLTGRGDDEVYNDEVRKALQNKGYKINNWGKKEAIINNQKVFIRPGSSKPHGWQITFRGQKPDSFKDRLSRGEGILIVPRGPILAIPLSTIQNFILFVDPDALNRDTIDIFFRFDLPKIVAVYKNKELDVTEYTIRQISG